MLLFTPAMSFSADWGGETNPITTIYIYPTYAVIVQSASAEYAGNADCKKNKAWSFAWGSFEEQAAQRIYSSLLAAYMSQKPVQPVFSDTECGPEGHKKFNGYMKL